MSQIPAPEDYTEPEITTLFYSALHMVDRYLILVKKFKPKTHYERRRKIRSQLKDISEEYSSLERLSKMARYQKSHHDLKSDDEKMAVECHDKIVSFVQGKLQKFGLDR